MKQPQILASGFQREWMSMVIPPGASLHSTLSLNEPARIVSTRAQCRGQGAEISTRRSAAEQRR